MANAKGEQRLTLGGRDLVISYSFNDFADADELLNRSVVAEFSKGEMRFDTIRALLYVGARPTVKSPRDAGSLLDFQNMEEVAGAIGRAITAAFPQAGEGEAAGEA